VIGKEIGLWDSSRPFVLAARESSIELVTGADVELVEDFMQVVFDSPRAHEELGSDFRVGQAVAGEQPIQDLDLLSTAS